MKKLLYQGKQRNGIIRTNLRGHLRELGADCVADTIVPRVIPFKYITPLDDEMQVYLLNGVTIKVEETSRGPCLSVNDYNRKVQSLGGAVLSPKQCGDIERQCMKWTLEVELVGNVAGIEKIAKDLLPAIEYISEQNGVKNNTSYPDGISFF